MGQFALYLIDIFDGNNKLHLLIVKDLVKFILNLSRTKTQTKQPINNVRFQHFAQKMSARMNKNEYLDYLTN